MRTSLKAALGAATLSIAAAALVAGPAYAGPIASTTEIAAGTSGTLSWGYHNNTGVTAVSGVFTSPITFEAPAHTRFSGTTVTTDFQASSADPWWSSPKIGATKCAIADGGAKLNCNFTSSDPNFNWVDQQNMRFQLPVTVDANAPVGTYSASNAITLNDGTNVRTPVANLTVKVTATKPAAPTVSKIDNSSGATVVSGTGVPGATVTITDNKGNTVGTATVGADGSWSANLGENLEGSPSDLSVRQTANGVASDATTISAADLPIVNPMIAGGAAVAAIAAFGTVVMIRRKRVAA